MSKAERLVQTLIEFFLSNGLEGIGNLHKLLAVAGHAQEFTK